MIQAFVTGNLGRDGELKDVGGDKLLSFSIASSKKVKGKDVTLWVRCSIWGKRADSLAQHMTKGKRVAVTGELSTREHDGKTYIELRVAELDFMSSGGDKRPSSRDDEPQDAAAGKPDDEGELPF